MQWAEGRAAALAVMGELSSYRPRCLGLARRGAAVHGLATWPGRRAAETCPANRMLVAAWHTANSGGAGGPLE